LRSAGVEVTVVEFDAGHEWAEPFVVTASTWLAERLADLS
jgi:predicted esterase